MKAERDIDAHPPVAKQILAVMVRGIFFSSLIFHLHIFQPEALQQI